MLSRYPNLLHGYDNFLCFDELLISLRRNEDNYIALFPLSCVSYHRKSGTGWLRFLIRVNQCSILKQNNSFFLSFQELTSVFLSTP